MEHPEGNQRELVAFRGIQQCVNLWADTNKAGRHMYKIYASRNFREEKPSDDLLVPYNHATCDAAVQQCVELHRKGYTIHKLVLPHGQISGDEIQNTIKKGLE